MRDEPGCDVAPPADQLHRGGELVRAAAAHAEHVDLLEREIADPNRGVIVGEADDHHAPGVRDELDGALDESRHARRLDHYLGTVDARPLADRRDEVVVGADLEHLRPRRLAPRQAARKGVDQQDGRSAVGRRQRQRLPDRARTEDDDAVDCRHRPPHDGANGDRHGLDQRGERRVLVADREDLGGRTSSRCCRAPSRWTPIRLMFAHALPRPMRHA